MTAPQPPRTREERKRDLLARLDRDADLWVASADQSGTPYLVPLSFHWTDGAIIVSTPETNPTGRNLAEGRTVRIGVGLTRDVTMIDATAELVHPVPDELADAFAARAGFDPRRSGPTYRFYRLTPTRIESWREANELSGRVLMRDGAWLEDPQPS